MANHNSTIDDAVGNNDQPRQRKGSYVATDFYVRPSYFPHSFSPSIADRGKHPDSRHYQRNATPHYPTNERADAEGLFRPDAPMTWMIPFVNIRLLPPDQVGRHIRGYCTPGYQDDKVARIRNNDEDPWCVAVHETLHFARIYGGDGSEEYVHMMEHWRMEGE